MTRVAAIGVGQTQFGKTSEVADYPTLLREATASALESCGLTMDDIDAVVLALAPESLMGINHGERMCVDAIAARNKPLMRVQTGGATGLSAVQAGYLHAAS